MASVSPLAAAWIDSPLADALSVSPANVATPLLAGTLVVKPGSFGTEMATLPLKAVSTFP